MRPDQDPRIREIVDRLTKELADDGRLIEAGWISLRYFILPEDAPAEQIKSMRWAFMAGSQHLFSSIVSMMEEGDEPTEADLNRMELIGNELNVFREEIFQAFETDGRS